MYCHRNQLAEELRKSFLGPATQPSRQFPSLSEDVAVVEVASSTEAVSGIAYGKALDIRPSVAMRKIPIKKRGSKIVRLVDPFRKREIQVESGLEESWALVLIANSNLREIREQQQPNKVPGSYINHYFVDFITTDRDGYRTAYEVKYAEDVKKNSAKILDRLKCLARDAGDKFANEYKILTEQHLSLVTIKNAELIVDCGCDADLNGQNVVRQAIIDQADGFITASRIAAEVGLGKRGIRATFALIQSGLLKRPRGIPLDQNTILKIENT